MEARKSKRNRHQYERLQICKASMREGEASITLNDRQFYYTKAHYRGLAEHTAEALRLFALVTLWKTRLQLIPAHKQICLQVADGATKIATPYKVGVFARNSPSRTIALIDSAGLRKES